MGPYIVLRGTGGLVKDEKFYIGYGESVIVGRSSSCDISLKKCEKYLLLERSQRAAGDHFQTVSRKHVQINFYSTTNLEIIDLSSNGTRLDGQIIRDKININDIRINSHELQLGSKEKFMIEWVGEQIPEAEEYTGEAAEEEGVIHLEDIEDENFEM